MNYFFIVTTIACLFLTCHRSDAEKRFNKKIRYHGLSQDAKATMELSTFQCMATLGNHRRLEELNHPPNPLFEYFSGAYYKCIYEDIGLSNGTVLNKQMVGVLFEPDYVEFITQALTKCWNKEILTNDRDLNASWHYLVNCMVKAKHRKYINEL